MYDGNRAAVRRYGTCSMIAKRPKVSGRLETNVTRAARSPLQRVTRLWACTSWPPKRKCSGGATMATRQHSLFVSWLIWSTEKDACDPHWSAILELYLPSTIVSCRNNEDTGDA